MAQRLRYFSLPLLGVVLVWIATSFVLADDPGGALRAHWPLFFLGIVGAVIGNATAVGGGLVFVPATMWFYGMDPLLSLQLAIGCQAFGMTSGAVAWWRRGLIPLNALVWGLPALLIGCAVGGFVARPDAGTVKALFGPVSIAIGAATLVFGTRPHQRTEVPAAALWGVVTAALAGAVLTAWVAIGVGELVAAYLMMRWGVRASTAIALGVAYLSLCSIGLAVGLALGDALPWAQLMFMGIGCILGARLGPYVAQLVPERVIKYGFATIAIGDGALFVVQYGGF